MRILWTIALVVLLGLVRLGCSAMTAEAPEADDTSALVRAAENGDASEVRRLLDAGENVNMDDGMVTPLIVAAENGHADVVRLLIERRADVNARDGAEGLTALDYAELGEHTAVINMLRAAGARSGVDMDEEEDDEEISGVIGVNIHD